MTDDSPGIVAPLDWRSAVAAYPQTRWAEWRKLAAEMLAAIPGPTAEDIHAADSAAYCIVDPDPQPL